jgi:predicted nucleotidyltransferase
MPLAQSLSKLKALESDLRAQGVSGLHVFGSQARDDASSESDLDLMFDIAPGARFSLFDQARIGRQLSDLLRIKVDFVPSRSLHPIVKAKADHERITIFG